MQILIDVTGGDNAPGEILKGAVNAFHKYDVDMTLIGNEATVKEYLAKEHIFSDKIQLLNASETIAMEEEPVMAIRTKKDSAIVLGCTLAKARADSAFISAGSTGALLTAATLVTGRLKGVVRPALATVLPGEKPTLLIDNGANADCKADYFPIFARMGASYMEALFDLNKPKIALANIGTEEVKGNALYKEAYDVLKNDEALNFVGNIEMKELFSGEADVICCDGFTGNMILKTAEGTFKFVLSNMKEVLNSSFAAKISALLIKNKLYEKKKLMDPSAYGGVPFLGINGNIIKAHGSSDAYAIENAVKQAIALIKNDILNKIKEKLQ